MELFSENTAQLFDSVKSSQKADGVSEIFIPGEIEQRNYEKAQSQGINLSEPVLKELRQLSESCGIPLDIGE